MGIRREIKADVKNIEDLDDFFFVVPDYQREYVWEADEQVEQFLEDINHKFVNKEAEQYLIGSIIIVRNEEKYDVIDGQQRLTTIVFILCAIRELLKEFTDESEKSDYIKKIERLLSDFRVKKKATEHRLELQYEESKEFLSNLIDGKSQEEEESLQETECVKRMKKACKRIKAYLSTKYPEQVPETAANRSEDLFAFTSYFLSEVEMVVIVTNELNNAFEIFETSNQRGVGLSVLDLVKNLLFRHTEETEIEQLKSQWRKMTANLEKCKEKANSGVRFLRYFIMGRYYTESNVLRESQIFNWFTSQAGKEATKYEKKPLMFVNELVALSERYTSLVNATILQREADLDYPAVSKIGLINKTGSRQHLIPLLALSQRADQSLVNQLANELESYFFFCQTLHTNPNVHEPNLSRMAVQLRKVRTESALFAALDRTLKPFILEKVGLFKEAFLHCHVTQFHPLYRQRYILGRIENTLRKRGGQELHTTRFIQSLQIEHILPRSPKDEHLPSDEFSDSDDYKNTVSMMGNVTLLDRSINASINSFNDVNGVKWFTRKQEQYAKSTIRSTCFLDHNFKIGKETKLNAVVREHYGYSFRTWYKRDIQRRQNILLELALDTWLLNGRRVDGYDGEAEG